MSLVRLAAFALFLLSGAGMLMAERTRFARAAERLFIVYFIALTLVAGLGNRDLWPFSSYPIIPESSERYREAVWYEVRAVDGNGREHRVDVRAWSPLSPHVIEKWIERTFVARLDDAGRQRAARFLLARMNADPCFPSAAPHWLLSPRGERVKAVALRIYRNDFTRQTLAYELRE
jgi:hypothetical protein